MQRLYEEHLSDDENDLENAPNNHLIVKNNINDVNIRDVTKHVDTCVSDFERSDIVNNKIIRHQSLLDELSRTEESSDSREKIESLKTENELQNSKVFIFTQQINSLAKDLPCVPASSLNSSAELSLTNSSPIKEDNNDEEKINENENETEFFQIDKIVQRSPSPVFKVSNRTKVTNEFLTPENVDTTCTPTSVYFSGRQNAYLKEVILK